MKATRRSARRQTKLARKTVEASRFGRVVKGTPPVRLVVALGGVAIAALAGILAGRRSRSPQPTTTSYGGPVPAPTPTPAAAPAPPAEHASASLPGADGSGDST